MLRRNKFEISPQYRENFELKEGCSSCSRKKPSKRLPTLPTRENWTYSKPGRLMTDEEKAVCVL